MIVWYRPDETARFDGALPPVELLDALLERAHVIADVHIDDPAGVPFSIDYPGGDARVLALFDHQRAFWPTMFGAGTGNSLGLSAVTRGPSIDVTLDERRAASAREERCKGERLELLEIDAPEVAASGSSRRRVCVRLPESYGSDSSRRYPVVYLLPGLGSSDVAYLRGNKSLGRVADELAHDGHGEVILAGIDTSTRHGSAYFTNSPTAGNWADFVPHLLAELDAHYRTVPSASGRALVGHSTGGFNAITLAFAFPGHFSAAGASAPDGLDLESWLLDERGRMRDKWLAWARLEHAVGGMGQMVSYAVAWSPALQSARGYRYPFDLATGAPSEQWSLWRARSPATWLDSEARAAEVRRALSGRIFLTVGKRDEFGLHAPTLRFAERLKQRSIEHELIVSDGGHFSENSGGLPMALAFVVDKLTPASESRR